MAPAGTAVRPVASAGSPSQRSGRGSVRSTAGQGGCAGPGSARSGIPVAPRRRRIGVGVPAASSADRQSVSYHGGGQGHRGSALAELPAAEAPAARAPGRRGSCERWSVPPAARRRTPGSRTKSNASPGQRRRPCPVDEVPDHHRPGTSGPRRAQQTVGGRAAAGLERGAHPRCPDVVARHPGALPVESSDGADAGERSRAIPALGSRSRGPPAPPAPLRFPGRDRSPTAPARGAGALRAGAAADPVARPARSVASAAAFHRGAGPRERIVPGAARGWRGAAR